MTADTQIAPSEGATASTDPVDTTLLDIGLLFAENLRLLIAAPLCVGVVVLGIGFLMTETFTASARLLPPVQQQGIAASVAASLGGLAGLLGGAKGSSEQYVTLLKSRPVADAMIERFNLKDRYKSKLQMDARRDLAGVSKIMLGQKDNIISIDVTDKDPQFAADMANAYVEELQKLSRKFALTEAAQKRLFFENQLKQTKDNLTNAEVELRASGVSSATLRTLPQASLEQLSQLRARISSQEIRLAAMRASMTESNPQYRLALNELAALRAELAKAEQADSSRAKGEGSDYTAKYRNFKYYETLFELVAKQYEFARLEEAREGTVFQLLEPAQPPERKSGPRKAIMAIVATLGTFVLMLVYLFIRRTIRKLGSDPVAGSKLARIRQLLLLRGT